ncbi:hypothetical protein [Nonomuraea pusilla]|uniref:Uncharacterized protein n=1 Tax=Nonomuraea pusilla TaxID=46177 RepID=A0A1H8D1I0_9ACTN|nr:hypothetical protein [Nonomuraea pusilla]SEN01002.1 hypothetical protein SAMN05660976_06626 [Nonomuraea pusilla]
MSPSRFVSAVAACRAMAGASTVPVSNFLLGFSVSVFLGKPGGGFEPAVRDRTGGQADHVGGAAQLCRSQGGILAFRPRQIHAYSPIPAATVGAYEESSGEHRS